MTNSHRPGERLYSDPDYYARIQKTKLAIVAVLSLIFWACGLFDKYFQ